MKNILFVMLVVLIFFNIKAQSEKFLLGNKSYFKENNKWYTSNFKTDGKFEVNTRSITVKLKNESLVENLNKLNKKFDIKILRKNILGYIDLELPENSDFISMYNSFVSEGIFEKVEVNSFGELLSAPNDPSFSYQYHLNHATRPDINALEGWDLSNNKGTGVIVAVIDEPIFYNHIELFNNKWTNLGYDFVEMDEDPRPDYIYENHGTHVAGIIAARTNNGVGVAGVAGGWGTALQGAQIMALRVIKKDNPDSSIIYSDAVDDAILYAAFNRVKIINMSFKVEELTAISDALAFAYDRGCLLVAAAGNDPSATEPYFPARNENVIAVAGLTWKFWDHLGNTGNKIEIAAPGEDIFSTTYSGAGYGLMTGTSQAAPQVSGTAALLFSDYELINFDVRNILKKTAVTNFSTYTALKFGSGLLKVDNALAYASNMPEKPAISISAPIGGHPTISWSAISGVDNYKIYRSEPNKRLSLSVAATTSNNSWVDYNVIVGSPKTSQFYYYYRVTSMSGDNESAVSNEVSCKSNSIWKESVDNYNTVSYKYGLSDNYPNPFNPTTKIKYTLKEKGRVQIKVFNALGQTVADLVNEVKPEGEHFVIFNPDNLPSGIYLYTIHCNDFVATKKWSFSNNFPFINNSLCKINYLHNELYIANFFG
ncbi:MAG: hypothetical protein COT22_04060 [Ignavibacteria bacterium CG08_land_8_20_14_0_20_37_9]|nr:MAG: hypothetical protein COT22_04060 [Ignavibacteria bacterium CG08_land_8_20_14_0_20_37_9]